MRATRVDTSSWQSLRKAFIDGEVNAAVVYAVVPSLPLPPGTVVLHLVKDIIIRLIDDPRLVVHSAHQTIGGFRIDFDYPWITVFWRKESWPNAYVSNRFGLSNGGENYDARPPMDFKAMVHDIKSRMQG